MNKQKTEIPLFRDISGNEIAIKGITVGQGFPRIYLQGGTHGGESTYYVLERVYRAILTQYKTGTVTMVPISNPISWNQRLYSITLGKFSFQDGKDWNRGFPGKDNGSLADIRSGKLYDFTSEYDVIIDLHTSRKSIPFGIFNEENADIELIKTFGFKYNYLISNQEDTSMMSALSKKGKVAFEIECGSHDSFEDQNINLVSERIISYLGKLGVVISTDKQISTDMFTFTHWTTIYSPISGFIKYNKEIGEVCYRNEVICNIGSLDEIFINTELKAVSDFVLIKKLQTNIIWTGDEVVQGINIDSLNKL